MTRESADARYLASVLMLCFATLAGTLTLLLGGGVLAAAFPVSLGVLAIALGVDRRLPENDPHAGVGE